MILHLSSCQFYGTMPSSIGSLSELVYLDLSYNNFNGVVGLEFIKDLKNLKWLYISNSGFSLNIGSFSSSFPKISTLILVGCKLTKIPTFIKHQDQMFNLNLSNKITHEIPPFICNIIGLTTLDLSNNKLTDTVPPCLLEDGIDLLVLNLGGNRLHGAVPHGISPKCEL
ncbi:hypothetical protein IEQ34_018636 [Dendrobium chrysotoxum]|uniref:Uncharacterized protein n=1 Tax=Dendrobium chrysotoxum TaxID=161865 RepID=A0AAV7G765_DENCH|nr:hypothetical protein IEQ34_018636 [Dendrobium chrysotoxum]